MRLFAVVLSTLLLAGPFTPAAGLSSDYLPATSLSPEGGDSVDPQIGTDAEGNVTAVWVLDASTDETHLPTVIQMARRTAEGTWSDPVTLSDPEQASADPQLAVAPNGTATVVWAQRDGASTQIQAVRRTVDGSWTTPEALGGPGYAHQPQLAVDPAGGTTAVWMMTGNRRHGKVQASSRRPGQPWSPPTTISRSSQESGDPRIAVDARGRVTAVWIGADRVQTARRSFGGDWTAPQALSAAGREASAPQIAANRRGGTVAVWALGDGSRARIQAAHRFATGNWKTPVTIAKGEITSTPRVVIDAKGASTVIWSRRISSADSRVVTVHRPAGQPWTKPTRLSIVPADYDVRSIDPQITVTEQGVTAAVWTTVEPENGFGPRAFIMFARHRSGRTWTFPRAITFSFPIAPQLAVDPLGNATTVWRNLKDQGGEGAFDDPNDLIMSTSFDATGPTAKVSLPGGNLALSRSFTVRTTPTDRWPGRISSSLRYRAASWNTTFGARRSWVKATTRAKRTFTGHPGRTYCFSARGNDELGNRGPWSTERCTTTPVDDRTGTATGRWKQRSHPEYYRSTYRTTRHHGDTLTLRNVTARQLDLLVATGPGNGRIKVTFAGTHLGSYRLTSPENTTKQILRVKRFAKARTGTLQITVTSATGKPVRIDGIYASR